MKGDPDHNNIALECVGYVTTILRGIEKPAIA
jgi:hypothetical protein